MTAGLDRDELITSFLDIAWADWFVTASYNRLHWADLTVEDLADVPEYWSIQHPVRLACGQVAKSLHIPGIFTRMGAMRCVRCCDVQGLPHGKGSPKNDAACRVLLGLPVKGAAS